MNVLIRVGRRYKEKKRVEAELRLTDPRLKSDVSDVLDLGVSRWES